MMEEPVERWFELRFPVVVPVEYFKHDHSGLLCYTSDLSESGGFISKS